MRNQEKRTRESPVGESETEVRFQLYNIKQEFYQVKSYPYPSQLRSKTVSSLSLLAALLALINAPTSRQQMVFRRGQQARFPLGDVVLQNQYQPARQLIASSPLQADHVPFQASVSRRSQSIAANNNNNNNDNLDTESRGAMSRNIYSQTLLRGARNATGSQASAASSSLGSWHFPRISPEQAAEVLLTGAQVINRIAQAETPLNYCKTPDNQEGECSDIRKCIWLVLDKARLKQSVCLRNLIIPAVCCPLSTANNTPIANMIQSTLEPVLFRPKAPKQKKYPLGAHMKPFLTTVNKTVLGLPPSSSGSLIIRNQNVNSSSQTPVSAAIPVSTSTSSSTEVVKVSAFELGSTASPAEIAGFSQPTRTTATPSSPSAPSAQTLFQDTKGDIAPQTQPASSYNRTLSQKYPWANETCGEGSRTRTGRIVGGSDSKLGQWPWMTAMYLNKRSPFSASGGEFWCGGALINRRFILTAAHCLSDQRGNKYRNDQVTIKLGGVDLVRHQAPSDILKNVEMESRSSGPLAGQRGGSGGQTHSTSYRTRDNSSPRNDDGDDEEFSWTSFITKALGLGGPNTSGGGSAGGGGNSGEGSTKSVNADKKQQLAAHAKKTYFREYRVASIKQHPKFQRHGFYNDIGLIELKSDVQYDDLISPICLPTEFDLKRDMSGYMATVLGWGTLSYGGHGSKLLQQVSMPIWNNKDCDERYLQHIGKTFVCAGFLTGGKDACQGDSGGPLMVSDRTGRWTLHGVVSFGKTCAQAGYPGVYTRVTEYLDWIRDNTDISGYTNNKI